VVESAGLENRCTLTGTVGSNPTLTATTTPIVSTSADTVVLPIMPSSI
jgi:hypothetical protein